MLLCILVLVLCSGEIVKRFLLAASLGILSLQRQEQRLIASSKNPRGMHPMDSMRILQGQQASQDLFPVMVGVLVAIKPQHLQWMLQGLLEGIQLISIQTGLKQYIHREAYLLALRPIPSSFTIFSLAMEVAMAITMLMIISQDHQADIVIRTAINSID